VAEKKARASTPFRYSLLKDVWKGAVMGEFSHELGLAGAATTIIMGFVPVAGTLCAVRDYIACRRKRDTIGAMLNFATAMPVIGGVPHLAATFRDVILSFEFLRATNQQGHRIRMTAIVRDATDNTKGLTHDLSAPAENADIPEGDNLNRQGLSVQGSFEKRPRIGESGMSSAKSKRPMKNGVALFSLMLALLTPILMFVAIGFLLPPVTVVTGHLASWKAHRMAGAPYARPGMAHLALLIGYLELVLFLAFGALIWLLIANSHWISLP
jgi:hypothetical protein